MATTTRGPVPGQGDSRRPTRDDVAARAGVSAATVSYVLNNGPRSVALETRARVLAAIADLAYHPNNVARSLRSRQSHLLGLVLPDSANLFFAELSQQIERAARERGYGVLLGNSQEDVARETSYLAALRDQRVDGIILIPTDAAESSVAARIDGIPVVALDRTPPGQQTDTIGTDAHRGGALAGEHLLALGHRRISFLHGPLRLAHARERLAGGLTALRAANVTPDDRWQQEGSFDFVGGQAAALALLSQPERPTAICCGNDAMALGALSAAHRLGVPVPDALSIIGFDDLPLAQFTVPALTTIAQPYVAMATAALEMLLARIRERLAGAEPEPPVHRLLETTLVVRGTTAAPGS